VCANAYEGEDLGKTPKGEEDREHHRVSRSWRRSLFRCKMREVGSRVKTAVAENRRCRRVGGVGQGASQFYGVCRFPPSMLVSLSLTSRPSILTLAKTRALQESQRTCNGLKRRDKAPCSSGFEVSLTRYRLMTSDLGWR
jgi:hypothetical protein